MGRKNKNARTPRVTLAVNTHLVYNQGLDTNDDIIVRYMGEQDEHTLKCWHPEGFEFWPHMGDLSRFNKPVRV